MGKYNCLFLMIFFNTGMAVYSQEWTAEDSLWMQRVQNGTEQIRLNDATRKAIESGTLIRDPAISKQLRSSPSEMPIVKSFEGITAPDNKPKPQELPLSVYKIYVKNVNIKDSLPVIRKEATGLGIVYGGSKDVDRGVGVRIIFDAEGILRSIFWPSHRAKKRNAKNANAWKTYNEY